MQAYVQMARPDHWIKNVFVLPGVLFAVFFHRDELSFAQVQGVLVGLLAACFVASSNYVLNELLDAERDRHHPVKKHRPAASGRVSRPAAIVEWLVLGALGCAAGFAVNPGTGAACALLWIMGCLYNIPPIRLKDRAYADVLSESVNNPIRMAIGWYSVGVTAIPPGSVLLAYWMFGAFLMAAKRFAEYREIGDPDRAARYRSSFSYYTETRLIVSILFYAALFGMFGGVFLARYRLEVVLASPLMMFAMAYYLRLAYRPDSPAQYPERLYREPKLMVLVGLSFAACAALLFVNLPWLAVLLHPTNPVP